MGTLFDKPPIVTYAVKLHDAVFGSIGDVFSCEIGEIHYADGLELTYVNKLGKYFLFQSKGYLPKVCEGKHKENVFKFQQKGRTYNQGSFKNIKCLGEL